MSAESSPESSSLPESSSPERSSSPLEAVPPRYEGPRLEADILRFWEENKVFQRTLTTSEGRPLFTFSDGPPTANGRPGLHHVLARTFKDLYPRYKTMRGYHAPRKAGWDTHGLPVEHEIEKELGIFAKQRIEREVGIAEFNRRCRESVRRYIAEWEKLTTRMGFWVDLQDAYYTYDNAFIESVWHLLKTLWDRGLIYRGRRVVPYDPQQGATLSAHEVAQGYKEVSDPSLYVRFPLEDDPFSAASILAGGISADAASPASASVDANDAPAGISAGSAPGASPASISADGVSAGEDLADNASAESISAGSAPGASPARIPANAASPASISAGAASLASASAGETSPGGVSSQDVLPTSLLIWTTTPWTLPANLGVAVDATAEYVWVRVEGSSAPGEASRPEVLVLAAACMEQALGERSGTVLHRARGEALVGCRYRRPFAWTSPPQGQANDQAKCWRVHAADFVSTAEGTGLVHVAPAYGADDLALGERAGLPLMHTVGLDGCFAPTLPLVGGRFFKDADPVLIEALRQEGLLWRLEEHLHNYPFGWRTGAPLIYYAKEAWFIRTSQFRERLTALNDTIHWVPEHIKQGRFGNWLAHNVDWALSRERFWGTPLPVWQNERGETRCIGSLAELEKLCGRRLRDLDLHRPAIDAITFEADGHHWQRVPEVIDCWFDSGAMSYAQWHYPFENQDAFHKHFPADYVCEAIDQTRGWFYALHAIAALVSDSVAFKNVVCLSHLVDEHGHKMSKSKGNVIDPALVFDRYGADPLRWYFLARSTPETQKRLSLDIVGQVAGSLINTLWNCLAFFVTYARLDGFDPKQNQVPEADRSDDDRWLCALLRKTVLEVTESLDAFDAHRAGQALEKCIDALSDQYIRRNRKRFWRGMKDQPEPPTLLTGAGKPAAAYHTLYEALRTLSRLLAPFMPFLSEHIHQRLVRVLEGDAPLSVHMAPWPEQEALSDEDRALIDQEPQIQRVVTLARSARAKAGIRARQPLAEAKVTYKPRYFRTFRDSTVRWFDALGTELNVKNTKLGSRYTYSFLPNLPWLGKHGYGRDIPHIRRALQGTRVETRLGKTFTLSLLDGRTLDLPPESVLDILDEKKEGEGYVSAEDDVYRVELDTRLTPDLIREGRARDLIHSIQKTRKQAGFAVSDRIVLGVRGDEKMIEARDAFRETIDHETLAVGWDDAMQDADYHQDFAYDGLRWQVRLKKTERT